MYSGRVRSSDAALPRLEPSYFCITDSTDDERSAIPLPDTLARINRYVTNPLARTVAGRIPLFAIVIHRGRKSGREYRTPIMIFRTGDGFVIALTYGADRDWVKNVLAMSTFRLEYRGRQVEVKQPNIIEGTAGLVLLPAVIRPFMKLLGVNEFMRLRAT